MTTAKSGDIGYSQRKRDIPFEKDGAVWFKASALERKKMR